MSLSPSTIEKIATAAAANVLAINNEDIPQYFLHCSASFDLEKLFDAPPQTLSLHELVEELPEGQNLDGLTPKWLLGRCHKLSIIVQSGQWTLADGHGLLPDLFPLLLAHKIGVPNAIFLDCALSLNPDLKPGHWAMLTDFANGFAISPLDGLHHLLPTPFPNLALALNQFQNSEIINALGAIGETPMLCTFLGRPGYHVFTNAETKMACAQGIDLIGHDLPLLLTFAHALGLRISSLVLAAGQLLQDTPVPRLGREDFHETAKFRSPQLTRFLRQAIAALEHCPQDEETPPHTAANASEEMDADDLIAASIRRSATRQSPLAKFLKRE